MKKYLYHPKSSYIVFVLILTISLNFILTSCSTVYITPNVDDTTNTISVKNPDTTPSDNNPSNNLETNSNKVSYNIGDIISYGSYEQDNNYANGKEPIEWMILDKDGNNYLLISRYALDSQSYNNNAGNVTWSTCSLRSWLNDSFINEAFTQKEQDDIIPHLGYGTNDKVFCLSGFEANNYLPNATDKKTSATAYAQSRGSYQENGACGWWLRGRGESFDVAARVNIYGEILTCDSSEGGVERKDYSVRPAIWVNYK